MLVIRRRVGETLLIGDDVAVEILALTQNYVKLGIRAPASVTILREEIRLTYDHNREASRLMSLESISGLAKIFREKNSESS